MSSVNKAILIGNLGRDPEVRSLNTGERVVTFSVATSESWRDKTTGEKRERTEWHDVVIYNEGLGKVAEQYLRKGSKVYIEGQLQTREWDDAQTGQKRKRTEIVLQAYRGELTLLGDAGSRDRPPLDNPRDQAVAPRTNDYAATKGGATPPAASSSLNDDIPF